MLAGSVPASAVDHHANSCLGSTVTPGHTSIGSTQRTINYDGTPAMRGGVYLNLNTTSYCTGAFPGGTMHINIVKCSNNATISTERSFTAGSKDKYIATNVLPTTCFKVRWRGSTAGSFKGVIFWWVKL